MSKKNTRRQKSSTLLIPEFPLLDGYQPCLGSISSLSIDGERGILAVASITGHVTCFGFHPCTKNWQGPEGKKLCPTASLLENTRTCGRASSQDCISSAYLKLEFLVNLQVPFSTPPKLLQFGNSSEYQVTRICCS